MSKDKKLKPKKNVVAKKRTQKKSKKKDLSQAQLLVGMRNESIAAKRFEMLFGDMKRIPKTKLPKTEGSSPFIIQVKNAEKPDLWFINAPLVGTLAHFEGSTDLFKNALSFAEATHKDAVIIPGDLIYCLVKKYGNQRPYETQVVDIDPDPELLELAYPKAVLDEVGPLANRLKNGKIVFMTIKVYLDHVFKLLKKRMTDAEGKALFSGPIYVTLAEMEEAVIMYYVNDALRAEVFQEKALASKKKSELKTHRYMSQAQIDEYNDWEVYERLMVLMGNAIPSHVNELKEQMLSYLVHRIESTLPNIKVIGIGDVYVRAGQRLIGIRSSKTTDSVQVGQAGRIRKSIYSHTKSHSGSSIPDVMLGAGLNPQGIGLYASFRSKAKKDTLDDIRITDAIQLPTCINSNLYREIVRRMVLAKDKIAKLAHFTGFESGVMGLSFTEPGPIPKIDWYRNDFLTNEEIFGSKESLAKYVGGEDLRSKMVYSYKEGCNHYGSHFVARYPSPDDPKGRFIKYHWQVLFAAFVDAKLPIHMYQNDGDIQQWYNYPTHKETNDKRLDPEDLLKSICEIGGNPKLTTEQKLKMTQFLAIENEIVAGVLQPEEQITAFGKAAAPYMDFFRQTIENAERAKIRTNGLFGIISFSQGNHNENSWKRGDIKFSEAKLTVKELLIHMLRAGFDPGDKMVACQSGGIGMAWGIFEVALLKDPYQYAIFMKHKQGSDAIGDNMTPMIDKFSHRASSTDDYEEGRFTINLGGDDHKGGHAITKNAFHIKTGGQMFSSPFGVFIDAAKQNLFSVIWGVPAGGPHWGACTLIRFDFRNVRKLAAYKMTLPKDLLPNPAGF